MAWVAGLSLSAPGLAVGQMTDLAPVAVDDSPVAQRALDEAISQARDNPERTAELAAELLDAYGGRVVPRGDDERLLESVRSRVIRLMRSEPAVLAAWRRAEQAPAVQLLEERGPEATFRLRPLTDAGLEAGLRLAQRRIETGQARAGLDLVERLSDWPGIDRESRRIDLLRALALVELASRDPMVVKARNQAIDSVMAFDADAGRWLQDMVPMLQAKQKPAAPPTIEEVRQRDWTPLWEIALEESLFLRRTTDPATGRVLAPASQASHFALGSFLVTLPTVIDDLVLINEGFLIEGIDRYTGRLRWYRDHTGSRGILPSGSPTDLNEIVCADGECYTLLGYGFGNQRGGDGAIIRFDPNSGEERWRVRPDRMSDVPLLEGADACGPPMVLGDLLVVPLRKQTNRVETIDLVAAFDRSDGRLRWASTIASSGSVRTAVPKPVSRLGEIDGDVLIASPAGGIARLDGASGIVRWLRVDDVRLRILSISNLAWQLAGPVVCDRGIAVMGAARDRWMLLDPEDGSLISSHPVGPGTRVGDACWLMVLPGALDGRDLLLAIGSTDVVAIDPAEPDRPIWSLTDTLRADGEMLGEPTNMGVRGRVFAIEGGVIVPTVDGLLAVSARDGKATRILPMPGPSNPVVLADAIYAGGSRLLSAAMPIDEAIAALESRIRERPDAIPQALALLELSERLGRGELVRFAADAAVSASLRNPDGRRRLEVLERILTVIARSGVDDGEHLLGLAERLASDPAGRVRLALVRGDWLTRHGRPLQAARAWLEVMDDPDVGSLEVPLDEDRFAGAAVAASWRLDALYRSNPEIADRIAAEGLETVQRAIEERAEARSLIGLARRHAGSPASVAATARAIEVFRDEGNPELAAAAALMAARSLSIDDPARRELLLEAAEVAREFDRSDFDRVLMRAAGSPGEDDEGSALPALVGIPSQIETLEGTPVPMSPSARAEAPIDGLLFQQRQERGVGSLVWLDAATLQPIWTLPRSGGEVEIVGWDPGILLWEAGDGREPRLTAVDEATGELLWTTPRTTEVMPPAGRLMAEADGLMPNGEPYESYRIVPIVTDHGVVFVRRDGSLSCIDLEDGRSVRWSRRGLMERVYEASSIGGLLHLAGASRSDDGTMVGRVVSLDPTTGVTVARTVLEDGEVRALVGDDLGRIAALTPGGVTMLDPLSTMLGFDGGWQKVDPRLGDIHRAWMTAGQVVLFDQLGLGLALGADFGTTLSGVWAPAPDETRPSGRLLEVVALGDRWLLRYDARVLLYDAEGGLVGADGIARRDRSNWATLPVRDGVLLISRSSRSVNAVQRVHRLDDGRGLLASGGPFDIQGRFDGIAGVEGWLLLSGGRRTYALSMSGDSEASTPDP